MGLALHRRTRIGRLGSIPGDRRCQSQSLHESNRSGIGFTGLWTSGLVCNLRRRSQISLDNPGCSLSTRDTADRSWSFPVQYRRAGIEHCIVLLHGATQLQFMCMGRIFFHAGAEFQTNDSVLCTRGIFLPPRTLCGQFSMAVVLSADSVARWSCIVHLFRLVGAVCEVSPIRQNTNTDAARTIGTRRATHISIRTRSVRRKGCEPVVCLEHVPLEDSQSHPSGIAAFSGPDTDNASDVPTMLEST
mmetsp:Transcript_5392/g.15657  ORF Transcript_5392/g.15657 Transcript_5392/m.15657 type:complete len:246 (+) Transcript_5392:503-1240(+)